MFPWRLVCASSSHQHTAKMSLLPFLQQRQQQRRCFTSIIDRLTSSLTSLADRSFMPLSDQCITEPRRPYPRRPSMPENLAERLTLQRRLRVHLVPSRITVSKDKMYIELLWPAAALQAVGNNKEEEGGKKITKESAAEEGKEEMTASPQRAGSRGDVCNEHRTTFLAEFLRAYSPSTDVIGADALIYGRRGITISDVIPVGNYALRIVFSDGHTGGIYPYEYLFHLGREKYPRMREYIRRLRAKRKTRDPPRRAPSQRLSRYRSAQEAEKNEG